MAKFDPSLIQHKLLIMKMLFLKLSLLTPINVNVKLRDNERHSDDSSCHLTARHLFSYK